MIILRSSNRYTWTVVLLNCIISTSWFGSIACAPKKALGRSLSTKITDFLKGGSDSDDLVIYNATVTDPDGKSEKMKVVYEECLVSGSTWNFYVPNEEGELLTGGKRFWFPFEDMDIQTRQADEKDDMVYFYAPGKNNTQKRKYAVHFDSPKIATEFQMSILDNRRPKYV